MADPRVVNGFRPLTKEIVLLRSSSSARAAPTSGIIDGNEYVDVLNGFGMSLFGWQPDFLREAIHRQVDLGYEIGPQHVLAGEVAELFCDVTGADRAAFCNTGSEAVMGCHARRPHHHRAGATIAIFTGAYHGIFDEVIVRGTRKLKSHPGRARHHGVGASLNTLVLDYGTPESLEILRSRADELAAIVVEPVQSRRPDFQPVEFLHELRSSSPSDSGDAPGVRRGGHRLPLAPPRRAGSVRHSGRPGQRTARSSVAGSPSASIAGKRAVHGRARWRCTGSYGDDSIPTVGVTYFAGTFVRHPLALAAAKAALEHLQRRTGPQLQEQLTAQHRQA